MSPKESPKSSSKKLKDTLPEAPDEEMDPPQEPLIPLGETGQILWDVVEKDLKLEDRERALLSMAADQFEELEMLKQRIRAEGVEAPGYKGQPKTSPHAVEARQQRLAIARLLGMIAIPGEEGDRPMTEASRRAKHAAHAKHLKEADLLAKRKRRRSGG